MIVNTRPLALSDSIKEIELKEKIDIRHIHLTSISQRPARLVFLAPDMDDSSHGVRTLQDTLKLMEIYLNLETKLKLKELKR